jgi:Transposase DDE domain
MSTSTSKPLGRRHKRATNNPDHARRTHVPAPSDRDMEQRLNELVKPAVFAELAYYRQLGMRSRLLNLPVMVALVLALLWRRVPGVCTLQRMLGRERILWTQPTRVSQAALSERLLTFPAVLFERVLYRVLARLPARLAARTRPLSPVLQAVQPRFSGCYALDGTILEALFRKLEALREVAEAPFAGQLAVVCDLATRLPAKLFYTDDPGANDKAVLPRLLAWLPCNSLLVFDLGFFAFTFFDDLTTVGSWFVTRLREKTSFSVQQVLVNRAQVRERIVKLGIYRSNRSSQEVRLIEVYIDGAWRHYVTNVLDPRQLSIVEVVELYDYRWRIETAFLLVKRLLDLAYLWVGSQNGVQLQIWATWLYYAVLIDLCDDVAELLQLPLSRISVEMVSRSLYFYVQAVDQGYSGDAASYLAREAKDLGIIKRPRSPSGPTVTEQIRLALVGPPLPAGP